MVVLPGFRRCQLLVPLPSARSVQKNVVTVKFAEVIVYTPVCRESLNQAIVVPTSMTVLRNMQRMLTHRERYRLGSFGLLFRGQSLCGRYIFIMVLPFL